MDEKIKHLEMIQGIISRMANNSFKLKGWAVTLVSGIFVLSEKNTDKFYFLIAYIPIVFFWLLDAYYLWQERLYRDVYEKVRLEDENKVDFSLKVSSNEFENEKSNYVSCLISVTEIVFYFPLALVCAGIIIVTHCI